MIDDKINRTKNDSPFLCECVLAMWYYCINPTIPDSADKEANQEAIEKKRASLCLSRYCEWDNACISCESLHGTATRGGLERSRILRSRKECFVAPRCGSGISIG